MKTVVLAIFVALFAAGLAVASPPQRATLTVTPATVASGDSFQVNGCGYTSELNIQVSTQQLDTNGNPMGYLYLAVPDSNGCISVEATTQGGGTGTWTIRAWDTKPNGSRGKLLATATVEVT